MHQQRDKLEITVTFISTVDHYEEQNMIELFFCRPRVQAIAQFNPDSLVMVSAIYPGQGLHWYGDSEGPLTSSRVMSFRYQNRAQLLLEFIPTKSFAY